MQVMHMLDIPYHIEKIDMLGGETQSAGFKQINPNGKVPALKLDDGRLLSESNAMMWYFAETGSEKRLIPDDPFQRAQVLQWMFFEQYSHEPYVAVARYIVEIAKIAEDSQEKLKDCYDRGHKAFRIMENHLTENEWLVGDTLTLADIALFAYTHVADEGGFGMSDYPAIKRWVKNIEERPDYIPMIRV